MLEQETAVTEVDDFSEVDKQRRIARSNTFGDNREPINQAALEKAMDILLGPDDNLVLENARLEHELAELKAGLEAQYKHQLDILGKVADGYEQRAVAADIRVGELLQERRDFATKYHEANDNLLKLTDDVKRMIGIFGGDKMNENYRYTDCIGTAMRMHVKTYIPDKNKTNLLAPDASQTDYENKAFYHLGAAATYESIQQRLNNMLNSNYGK